MSGLVLRPPRESDAGTLAATEIAVFRPCRRLRQRSGMTPEGTERERRFDARSPVDGMGSETARWRIVQAVTGEGLAHALLDATAVIEIEAGVNLDADVAEKALESLVAEMQDMSSEERELLRRMAAVKAAAETVPERKRFFADFAEAYRLFDEEQVG